MGEDYNNSSVYKKYVRPCLLAGAATFAAMYGTLLFIEPSYDRKDDENQLTTDDPKERTIDVYMKRVKRQWPKHIKPFLEDILGDL